jgi:hypothetical protein
MKDDEYTRILAIDIRAANNSAAKANLPAIIRSLRRPNAKAFAEYLAGQVTDSTVLGPDGKPLGTMTEVDKDRVSRTGARIIRGLYFIEMHKPMPEGAVLKVGLTTGLTASDPNMQTIARSMHLLPDRRDGSVGDAFSYVGSFGGGMSFWLMLLYDYAFWLGTVDERALGEQGSPVAL